MRKGKLTPEQVDACKLLANSKVISARNKSPGAARERARARGSIDEVLEPTIRFLKSTGAIPRKFGF